MGPYPEAPDGFQPPQSPADQWEAQGRPFTTADDMRLHTLDQSASSVDDQAAEGTLYPEEADRARKMIDEQRGPLVQRKLATQKMLQAQQREQLTDEMAFGQSVKRANMAHDAAGFAGAIGHDPVTGQRFAPPGWQQIEQPEPDGGGSYGGGETNDNYGPGAQTEWPEGEMGNTSADDMSGYQSPKLSVPLTLDPVIQRPNMTPAGPRSDGTQPMTIWNGAYRTEAVYGPDGKLLGPPQTFAPNGRPMGQAPPPADDGRGRFFAQAAQMVGPAPQQYLRGVHGQQIPNPQYGRWQQAVSGQATRLLQEDIVTKKEQRKAMAEAEKEHGDKWVANYDKYYNSAVSHWEKVNKDKEMDDNVRKRLIAQAEERADQAHRSAYGRLPKSREEDLQREADQAGAKARGLMDKLNATGGPTGGKAPAANPAVEADAFNLVRNFGESDEAKAFGFRAIQTIKDIKAQYGSLDKAPAEARAMAMEEARRLDAIIVKARQKREAASKMHPQGFQH